jgi:hypothetical protein
MKEEMSTTVSPRSGWWRHALCLGAVLALGALALTGCLPAAAPPPTVPPRVVPAPVSGPVSDYATDTYSDPWDFANAEDFNATPNVQSANVANVNVNGTTLHLDTPGPGGTIDLTHAVPGSIPTGRDSRLRPIDGGTYPDLSFSMRSSAPDFTQGLLIWYTCPEMSAACQGMFIFTKTGGSGFTTYNYDMRVQSYSGAGWSGPIYDVRFQPSNAPASIDFDWIRVRTPSSSIAPPANPYPLPVIDSPSSAGTNDYPAVTRGDPWDFVQASDVASTQNLLWGVGNGVLNGYNVGPNPNDPQVQLSLGPPIDGTAFHHLMLRVWYAGPFGLQNAPGGGMVGRLVWTVAGHPTEFQDSDDIIVYPGWNTIEVDLATNPAGAIVDPNTPFAHYGWWGQQITFLRFDPHEDPGQRQFLIDDIRLTDDSTGNGSFPIQFHDNAWEAGTVADVYAQASDGSVRGLGSMTMAGPSATFNWSGAPAGTWWIFVRLRDPAGQWTQRYATGPLRIT